MLRDPTRAALAVLVLACAGCTSARPLACPGDRIATLTFHGTLVDGSGCGFVPATLDFTAIVSSLPDGTAALCVQRPEAAPLVGTLTGNHLVASTPGVTSEPSPCRCTVSVAERVEGDLTVDPAGDTFTGELSNAVTPSDGVDPATCEPPPNATGSHCGAPCEARWTLTAR